MLWLQDKACKILDSPGIRGVLVRMSALSLKLEAEARHKTECVIRKEIKNIISKSEMTSNCDTANIFAGRLISKVSIDCIT